MGKRILLQLRFNTARKPKLLELSATKRSSGITSKDAPRRTRRDQSESQLEACLGIADRSPDATVAVWHRNTTLKKVGSKGTYVGTRRIVLVVTNIGRIMFIDAVSQLKEGNVFGEQGFHTAICLPSLPP